MANSIEHVTAEALKLPSADRALLIETLLESLSGEADPAIERGHLDEIRRRRAAVAANRTLLQDGEEALRRARGSVSK